MIQIRIATYIAIALHFIRLAVRRARVRLNNQLKPCFYYNPGEINYTHKVVVFCRSIDGKLILTLAIRTESEADGYNLFNYLIESMDAYWMPYIYLFFEDTDILHYINSHRMSHWMKQSAPIYVPDEFSMLTQKIENYAVSNLSGKIAIMLNEICRI